MTRDPAWDLPRVDLGRIERAPAGDAVREALERTNITLQVLLGALPQYSEARRMAEGQINRNRAALSTPPAAEPDADAVRSVTCPFCEAEFVDPTLHDANVEIHRLRKAAPPAAVQGEAVPREPTEAMLDAGDAEWEVAINKSDRELAGQIWRAMWDAAHPVTKEVQR